MDTNPSDIDVLMARCLARESDPAEMDRLEKLLSANAGLRTEFEVLQLLYLDTRLVAVDNAATDHLGRVEKRLRHEGLI